MGAAVSSIAFNPDGSPIPPDTTSRTGYTIYKFEQVGTGTLVPTEELLNVEVLVAAGGGGGGADTDNSGYAGGGAGGLSLHSGMTIAAGSHNVVVGVGGTKGATAVQTAGGDSSFGSIVSDGGAAGRNNYWDGGDVQGYSGGSGGGVRGNAGAAGLATQGDTGGATGYGENGGDSHTVWASSGGGGAGGVGTQSSTGNNYYAIGGCGGDPHSSSITGVAKDYCQGGAGSSARASNAPVCPYLTSTDFGGGGYGGCNNILNTDGISGTVIFAIPDP